MAKIKTIAFFNNKGGVGKTTLACNFASWLSIKQHKKVIVLDCDPQANATQLSLTDEKWDEIYSDINRSYSQTILHVFQEIIAGNSNIQTDYKPQRAERFKYDILSAHPNLANVEDDLSSSWTQFGIKPGGTNRTIWLRKLCKSLEQDHEYDYAIIDMGPSLGALNRSIIIGCDTFITPVEPSLFSQYALLNIGTWVTDIIRRYNDVRTRIMDEPQTSNLIESLPQVLPITNGWLGYTIQQYFVKKYKKEQKIQSYEYYKAKIAESSETLLKLLPSDEHVGEIGTIPYMFSMAPRAQAAHTPIACLTPDDGLIGGQVRQRDKYAEQLEVVFEEILRRLYIADTSTKH